MSEKLTETVQTRLSLDQRREVEAAAAHIGVTRSTFLRMAALRMARGDGKG